MSHYQPQYTHPTPGYPPQWEQDIDNDSPFSIEGPLHMPFKKLAGGWKLQKQSLKEFWQDVNSRHSKGVYIATIKIEQTEIPLYVGRTEKANFTKECFTTDKAAKYHNGLADYPGGTPQMYFIASL